MALLTQNKLCSALAVCMALGTSQATLASDFFDQPSQLFSDAPHTSFAGQVADLDGDGDIDVLTAGVDPNLGVSNKYLLQVWINDGSGTFSKGQSLYDDTKFHTVIALGHLDNDDDIDAFTLYNGGIAEIFLNDGNGNFSAGQSIPGVAGALYADDAALAHLNNDDHLDVFIANQASVYGVGLGNTVLFNNGDGTFTDSGQLLGSGNSSGVSLADLNGDGHIDAFVSNKASTNPAGTNKIWFNDGNGIFTDSGQDYQFTTSLAQQGGAAANKLADLNGDGVIDAVAITTSSNSEIIVLLNDPVNPGTFTLAQSLLNGSRSDRIALADFDKDGDVDLFVGEGGGNPNKIWLNDGTGQFMEADSFEVEPQQTYMYHAYDISIGDFNGDSLPDIFNAVWTGNPDQVWLNQYVSPCSNALFTNNTTLSFDLVSVELSDPLQNLPTGHFAVFEGGNMKFELSSPPFSPPVYQLSGSPTFKEVHDSAGTANCHPVYDETDDSVYFPVIEIPSPFGSPACYEATLVKNVSGDYQITGILGVSCQ